MKILTCPFGSFPPNPYASNIWSWEYFSIISPTDMMACKKASWSYTRAWAWNPFQEKFSDTVVAWRNAMPAHPESIFVQRRRQQRPSNTDLLVIVPSIGIHIMQRSWVCGRLVWRREVDSHHDRHITTSSNEFQECWGMEQLDKHGTLVSGHANESTDIRKHGTRVSSYPDVPSRQEKNTITVNNFEWRSPYLCKLHNELSSFLVRILGFGFLDFERPWLQNVQGCAKHLSHEIVLRAARHKNRHSLVFESCVARKKASISTRELRGSRAGIKDIVLRCENPSAFESYGAQERASITIQKLVGSKAFQCSALWHCIDDHKEIILACIARGYFLA